MGGTGRKIVTGTLLAGTLDILSACVYAAIAGKTPERMLQGVASAILGPAAMNGGWGSAAVGLALHFAIMLVMVAIFVFAAQRIPTLKSRWLLAGIAYGIATWAVMNLIVLPVRFGWHTPSPLALAEQFFSHIVLVGIPIAWVARR